MTLTDYCEAALCRKVKLETREGVVRSGRLTSVRPHDMRTDRGLIRFPNELILDGDEVDPIPVRQVVSIVVLD